MLALGAHRFLWNYVGLGVIVLIFIGLVLVMTGVILRGEREKPGD